MYVAAICKKLKKMIYSEFVIKNFKGIEELRFNLDGSPNANIFTLVGLNESGKTTILEAMNLFTSDEEGSSPLDIPGSIIKDLNAIIPISKRDNFNGIVSIEASLIIEDEDRVKINEFIFNNSNLSHIDPEQKTLHYYRHYNFVDSKFSSQKYTWSTFRAYTKDSPFENKVNLIEDNYVKMLNDKLADLCKELIPSILYFPNFLFDFPSQIKLEVDNKMSPKDKFYRDLIQDVLSSLNNDTNLDTHIINRVKSKSNSDKRALDRLKQLMENKITSVVFDAWKKVFKRSVINTSVKIDFLLDESNLIVMEFSIESQDGIYMINERSLGFKWFFIFLLFTQFRPFRKDAPKNTIFLFDEPASNLHPNAQQQLLNSFQRLTENCKIIYTTHSHHLINPEWLERTYVVKNEGLDFADPENYNIRQTKITIQSYRDFATLHPSNTAYFQPILDVLEYAPSNLELLPDCIFMEGKNDYYTLRYFDKIVFNSETPLKIAPSSGSSSLDTLISLYIGWNKNFIILLDSDESGVEQKKRYIDKFGMLVEKRIFLLSDINKSWDGKELENLISSENLLSFSKTCYPKSIKYNKKQFNRSIQENLIKNYRFEFDSESISNIKDILAFLRNLL